MQECVANIGPRGRQRRLIAGLLWLVLSVPIGFALADDVLWLRALLFLPLLGAAIGIFQYLEKT
jgi:hypothetical protein